MEQNQEIEKQPIGSLFGTINYYSLDDLDKFVSAMGKDQALYCLIQSVHLGFQKQIFSMQEIEVLSKCLRLIVQKDEK
jgi:hypothetical protein